MCGPYHPCQPPTPRDAIAAISIMIVVYHDLYGRAGEIIELKWSNVDFYWSIHGSVVAINYPGNCDGRWKDVPQIDKDPPPQIDWLC